MTHTVRLRLVTIFTLFATGIGIALTVFAFTRATVLQSLRLDVELSLQSMYRLSNVTYDLLYTADDIESAHETWQNAFGESFERLDDLSFHEGLPLLGTSVVQQVRQTRNLWSVTTNGFVSGNDLLLESLQFETSLVERTSVADVLAQVRAGLTDGALGGEYEATLFDLQRAFFEIDATNAQLWFFATSALEGLGSDIQSATDRITLLTVIITAAVVLLLLAFSLVAIFTSLRLLRSANVHLEGTVRERTRSIQSLLDFSGEGFLSFGNDLKIRPEISRECDAIFGRSVVGEHIAEVLFSDAQKRDDLVYAMKLVFSGSSRPEVVFDVMDHTVTINGKVVEINFRAVDEATVMCSLRDITETEALQKELEEQTAAREMVLRIVTARPYFLNLVEEAQDLFGTLESHVSSGSYTANGSEHEAVVRALHTFKSNAGFLRMRETARLAHELETALTEYTVLGEAEPLGPEIAQFRRAFDGELSYVTASLGEHWISATGIREVDGRVLRDIYTHARDHHPDDETLLAALDSISRLDLADLFSRMSDLAHQLAAARGKRVEVVVTSDDITVAPAVYHGLSDALQHLIRNMVDHGIEFPRHREKAGKSPVGRIRVTAREEDNAIRIEISDDGAGIPIDKIKERAVERGLATPDDPTKPQDLMKMVFVSGFSTAEAVTAVSGRGVGLSVVRDAVRALDGRIGLSTRKGRGTQFSLLIPNKETGA